MQERVYECKKCGEKGVIDNGFYVKFIGKQGIRKVKHQDCGGDSKWLKDERFYVHEANKHLEEVEESHGIYMGSYVTVIDLEEEGMLKVIGIKRGQRRKLYIDVWNPETKLSWGVPVKNIKKVWNANEA